MKRQDYLNRIKKASKNNKILAILGPRQCGKTTLARQYFKQKKNKRENYFDLENPVDLTRLRDPLLALEELEGLIVVDEIQRAPNLFSVLRVLVDREECKQQYLILGSASRELIQQSSETLAGRIHYIELTPFSYSEINNLERLWLRGGFPLSYLAKNDGDSMQWRRDYIKTFLEQDIPNLGIKIPPEKLRRFWMMLAHYHGQTCNVSEIGNAMDISHHTVQKYIDILSGTFMVRQLAPWFENISKRQVKSKKIYFRDSGILHTLLNIPNKTALLTTPKIGASWEGFALESVIRKLNVDPYDCYYWGVHNQAELDLLVIRGTEKLGIEFKFSKTPTLSRSMRLAMQILKLNRLLVIYSGDKTIKLTKQITCIGLRSFLNRASHDF